MDDKLPYIIRTDSTKLHRILLNLLSNAVKFTKQGSIELSARLIYRKKIPYLQCSIKDSGCGIKQEDIKHIFKKFYRVSPSYQGKYSGHGVGLHIVKQYTKMLKGTIKVDSVFNQGTTFTLAIPITIVHSLQNNDVPQREASSYSYQQIISQNKTCYFVLLVEDNPIALKTLEIILQQNQINYLSATNGIQAFELAQQNTFDLVITDLGLPDFSGRELTLLIRNFEQQQKRSPVPIIALTAHATQSEQLNATASGINELLMKPMTQELWRKISHQYLGQEPLTHNKKILQNELPQELFQVDKLSLLDEIEGVKTTGNRENLVDMLYLMLDTLPQDAVQMQQAYKSQGLG